MANGTTAIDTLSSLLMKLKGQYAQLESELSAKLSEVEAVKVALTLLRVEEPADRVMSIDPSELRGKSQLQALITIANANSGKLKVTRAKSLMLQAEMFKTPKNASQIVYNVIRRSDGVFEWVSPGVYRLKSRAQAPISVGGSETG